MRLFPCLSGVLYVTALIVATYLLLAYAVLPWMWTMSNNKVYSRILW